jgi:ADP-heptose:LPS heptosyltransferase
MAKLGDFIQSTPFLAALRSTWPGRAVTLAGGEAAVLEAARLSPLVEETLALGPGRPEPEGEFEAVFNLNSASAAARLSGRVRAGRRFGPTAEGETLSFTPVQKFLMGLMAEDRRLGRFNLADVWLALAPEAGPRPLVWPLPALAPRGPGLRVGFHLGAKNHLRRWPVENFVRLAQTLGRLTGGFTPVLTGSAGERVLGAKFEKLGPPAENLLGATDLSELSRVLAGLDLLVTADTGVLHLAAALGTPVLALFFGPAYGPETGPYGPGHLVYQAEAPCGPCREGLCRRRQCLAQPDPDLAARLAASLVSGRPLADDLPAEPWPPGHRAWRTGMDAFGQSLKPLGRPPLTADEALALALTWAGQPLFRPGFHARPADLAELAALYAPPAGRPILAEDRLRRLAGRLDRAVREALARGRDVLGLEIATA